MTQMKRPRKRYIGLSLTWSKCRHLCPSRVGVGVSSCMFRKICTPLIFWKHRQVENLIIQSFSRFHPASRDWKLGEWGAKLLIMTCSFQWPIPTRSQSRVISGKPNTVIMGNLLEFQKLLGTGVKDTSIRIKGVCSTYRNHLKVTRLLGALF